ncbi:hypothetical protein [Acetomicrobium sp.]|uniref:hypothetical protein n=1 Tax=Acetomicrobium sp. TaxID=1872099 RepID=UPI002FC9EECA
MGHAGAIIVGNKGTAASKMEVLAEAGVHVARNPREVVEAISECVEVNFNEYIH